MTLITGCARSGTGAIAKYLGAAGLDLGHELRLGADGIASWFLARRDAIPPAGHATCPRSWDRVVHLVRNPLDCIASLSTLSPGAWRWIQQYVWIDDHELPDEADGSAPIAEMKYWLQWNRHAEARADERWRIEDCDDHGLGRRINSRPHRAPGALGDSMLSDAVRRLAQGYGYDV